MVSDFRERPAVLFQRGGSTEEAIAAVTWNAACVLGIGHQAGAIRPGMRALLQLLPHRDERAYVHEVAGAGPDVTIMGEDVSVRVA